MKLVDEKHIKVMNDFREKLDAKGIKWIDCSDSMMSRTKFSLNMYDKNCWSVICGSGSIGADDGLLEVWNPKDDDPSGGYTTDEVMEMIEKEKTMPTKGIDVSEPNRYKLIKDVIEWAVTHDKTVSISEVNEVLSVTIHNDDEWRDEYEERD